MYSNNSEIMLNHKLLLSFTSVYKYTFTTPDLVYNKLIKIMKLYTLKIN
jgi:hypothetical protein